MKTRFTGLILSIFTVGILFTAVASVNAATFAVNDPNDVQDATAGDGICATAGAVCTLRAAITEANALAGADIITLPAGTYTITLAEASDNANANGDFDINTDITINGAGSATTIVQANAAPGVAVGRVFHIRFVAPGTTAVINDLTIQNGRYTTAAGTFGAGVRVDVGAANATFNRVVITNNQDGTSGGGLAVSGAVGSTTTLNSCTVSSNTAGGTLAASSIGAGIMLNSAATVNLNNSTVTGNTASNTSTTVSATGGGISSIGTLSITDSSVTTNSSTSSGFNAFTGGVHVTAGTTTILRSTIADNVASVTAGTGAAIIGGVYNQNATVNITDSSVIGNSTVNVVTPATAFHAGVRTLAGTVAATTNITNSTIRGNSAGGEGGGVVNFATSTANSTVNITRSTISGNRAIASTAVGGGVENFASAAIAGLAVVNLTNSTVSGNTTGGNGAGTWNGGATATINLNYATVAGNTATGNGGGLYQDTTGVTNLKNSIAADGTAATGPDIFGTITSQDYNHVENVTGGVFFASFGSKKGGETTNFFALANDVTGTDPLLGALANNGGATQTQLPAVASPVVNTIPSGTSDCGTTVTTSQNGVARPQQTGCEKGGAERSAPTAANASIRGRLLTSTGRGLTNAFVVLTNTNNGEVKMTRTTSLGYFNFNQLESGDFYILSVQSKRYTFENRSFTLNDNIDDLVLTAQ
jgi:Carboxypeptidase regulatory-like domain